MRWSTLFGTGKNKKSKRLLFWALLLLLSAILGGCTTNKKDPGTPLSNSPPSLQPGYEQDAQKKLDLPVYYVKITENDAYLVREVHQVPYTKEVARATLEELIKGTPSTPGAMKVLPPATKILGITIRDGMATVNFSRDVLRANVGASGEALGIQSIVNTLTEFPSVQKVSFLVEGKVDQESVNWWGHVGLHEQPFTRNVSQVNEPAIWVTAPTAGQKITSPVTIKGSARVFEAAVSTRIVDESGQVLARGFGTATEGAPGRGDFVITLPFPASQAGKGKLEVYWGSPRDGQDMDIVSIPVTW